MASRYLAAVLAAAILVTPSDADAQRCANGGVRGGDLGFDEIGGGIHTYQRNNERPQIQFEGEPRIGGVRGNGPAAGKLRDGDVIVAIDGIPVQTADDVIRIASSRLDPGRTATFSIVRDSKRRQLRVRLAERPRVPTT